MLCFFHTPKTAGTSVREFIRTKIHPKSEIIIRWANDVALISDEQLRALDFISGHIGYSLLGRLRPRPYTLSFFRNPIDRTISQYRYFQQLQAEPEKSDIRSSLRKRPLKELLRDTDSFHVESAFRNTQCWNMVSDWWFGNRPKLRPEEALEIAKSHVMQLDFVGLVEQMDVSLTRLCSDCGWENSGALSLNVTSSEFPAEIDQETIDMIAEQNQLDIDLYEFVRREFYD